MSNHPFHVAPSTLASNASSLKEHLDTGQQSVSSALAQLSRYVCDTLKTIEQFTEEQSKLQQRDKNRMVKMDKVIQELSEKCQTMQQALLFKEEKYDEKCREVERYKIICETNFKEAIRPTTSMADFDLNNNYPAPQSDDDEPDRKGGIVKFEHEVRSSPCPSIRPVAKHAKFRRNQAQYSQMTPPLIPVSSRPTEAMRDPKFQQDDDRTSMAQYYAGGPSKRETQRTGVIATSSDSSNRIKDRFEVIGGVNIRGQQQRFGSVPLDRLTPRLPESSFDEDFNKRVKIELTGQRNEILSSSEDNMRRMKQRIVERDLHKQVSGGTWMRLASRRRKDWPF